MRRSPIHYVDVLVLVVLLLSLAAIFIPVLQGLDESGQKNSITITLILSNNKTIKVQTDIPEGSTIKGFEIKPK